MGRSGGNRRGETGEDLPSEAWFAEARALMVAEQLAGRGIRDLRVLEAMARIPRHRFVDDDLGPDAYEDRPLPIGDGQTISQPYMVARATELAAPQSTDRALEVGAGSGYQMAVLAALRRGVRRQRRMARARALRRDHRVRRRPPHPPVAGGGAGRRRTAGHPGRPAGSARTGRRAPGGRPLHHLA